MCNKTNKLMRMYGQYSTYFGVRGNFRKKRMDSKFVTKEIKSKIKPLLKENGFQHSSGRTFWRYQRDRIDILNFQSFNAYNASVLGCTTFSFSVNLSVLLNYIPSETEISEKNGLKIPSESQGHFRSPILKRIEQKEFQRQDIWFVDNEGENLTRVFSDCKSQIETYGLSWFQKFDSKESVYETLNKSDENMKGTWGFGNKNSPMRNRLLAFTAIELKKYTIATEKLKLLFEFYSKEYKTTKYEYYLNKMTEIETQIEQLKNYPSSA